MRSIWPLVARQVQHRGESGALFLSAFRVLMRDINDKSFFFHLNCRYNVDTRSSNLSKHVSHLKLELQ